MKEKELFQSLVDLFTQQLVTSEDISQLKKDVKFHAENNPQGILADDIKLIAAAAKIQAKNEFEEFTARNAAVKAKFEELTDYHE